MEDAALDVSCVAPEVSARPAQGDTETPQNMHENERKRSRITVSTNIESSKAHNTIEEATNELEAVIQLCYRQANHESASIISKESALASIHKITRKVNKLTSKTLRQEEKISSLLQQIIDLQYSSHSSVPSAKPSYLDTARNVTKTRNIQEGKQLPIPQVPTVVRHAPSEEVIIIKVVQKGTIPTKESQTNFISEIKEVLGHEIASEVSAVRLTKYGRYIIIMRSAEVREKAIKRLEQSHLLTSNRLVAPLQKKAKMVCREVPSDTAHEAVLRDLYGKHNPDLQTIPAAHRKTLIYPCKLGWIFELSSLEAAAITTQGGKIRFGFGREIKLEEFIPLQQCFRYCLFGHNAADCTSTTERCRLCAASGHSGRSCPLKDNKQKWRCNNCITINTTKNMKLSTDNAAAQLHKCNVAEHEKEIKRMQLASAGVFTRQNSHARLPITINWGDQTAPSSSALISSSSSSNLINTPQANQTAATTSSKDKRTTGKITDTIRKTGNTFSQHSMQSTMSQHATTFFPSFSSSSASILSSNAKSNINPFVGTSLKVTTASSTDITLHALSAAFASAGSFLSMASFIATSSFASYSQLSPPLSLSSSSSSSSSRKNGLQLKPTEHEKSERKNEDGKNEKLKNEKGKGSGRNKEKVVAQQSRRRAK